MKISKLKELLRNVPKDLSILLLGAPGIGKTEVVKDFAIEEAESEDRIFTNFHEVKDFDEILQKPEKYYIYLDLDLTKINPDELLGIPSRIGNEYFIYVIPLWAKILSLTGISGLLFLDEITNVQRDDIIAAAYRIILDRVVGFTKLSNNVRVICAGNAPEHSSIARMLPAPLTNRLLVVKVDAPSIEDWYIYMNTKYGDKWCTLTYAYLTLFPEDLLKPSREIETLENYPTPRSWTKLALTIASMNLANYYIIEELARGLLGDEVGTRFSAFMRKKVPDIEEFLQNPALFKNLDNESKAVMCWIFANWIMRNFEALESHSDVKSKVISALSAIMEISSEFVVLIVKMINVKDLRLRFVKMIKPIISKILNEISEVLV